MRPCESLSRTRLAHTEITLAEAVSAGAFRTPDGKALDTPALETPHDGAAERYARIWIVAGFIDLRRGFDRLCAMMQNELKENAFAGDVYIFCGKRGDKIKVPRF